MDRLNTLTMPDYGISPHGIRSFTVDSIIRGRGPNRLKYLDLEGIWNLNGQSVQCISSAFKHLERLNDAKDAFRLFSDEPLNAIGLVGWKQSEKKEEPKPVVTAEPEKKVIYDAQPYIIPREPLPHRSAGYGPAHQNRKLTVPERSRSTSPNVEPSYDRKTGENNKWKLDLYTAGNERPYDWVVIEEQLNLLRVEQYHYFYFYEPEHKHQRRYTDDNSPNNNTLDPYELQKSSTTNLLEVYTPPDGRKSELRGDLGYASAEERFGSKSPYAERFPHRTQALSPRIESGHRKYDSEYNPYNIFNRGHRYGGDDLTVSVKETTRHPPYRTSESADAQMLRQYEISPKSLPSDYSSASEQGSPYARNIDDVLVTTYHMTKTTRREQQTPTRTAIY